MLFQNLDHFVETMIGYYYWLFINFININTLHNMLFFVNDLTTHMHNPNKALTNDCLQPKMVSQPYTKLVNEYLNHPMT